MIGSLLFGGTFMGITTLATTLARELHPHQSHRAIATMTGTYGIGQIAGAAGAGEMARISGGFSQPTIIAAAIVALGVLFLLVGALRAKASLVANHSRSTRRNCAYR
jgi:predicted MFS family arabinose efflux permease